MSSASLPISPPIVDLPILWAYTTNINTVVHNTIILTCNFTYTQWIITSIILFSWPTSQNLLVPSRFHHCSTLAKNIRWNTLHWLSVLNNEKSSTCTKHNSINYTMATKNDKYQQAHSHSTLTLLLVYPQQTPEVVGDGTCELESGYKKKNICKL